MKIIALFPIKNDSWILHTTIPQLKLFADEILALDGESTDDTVSVLKSYGVEVRSQDQKKVDYSGWRKQLLAWGRERGGTHFIWLDSDEAFTTNFLSSFKEELQKMKPGQKLVMKWLCLWKDPFKYRNDDSVWSDLYKDFVYCDDGVSNFELTAIHEGRTPGTNNEETWLRIPAEKGAVLHYQFVSIQRLQMKQAYQRCREWTITTTSPQKVNLRYLETMDTASARCKDIPEEWITGIGHTEHLQEQGCGWFHAGILGLFKEKGILFFEPLQIWHIPELRQAFVDEIGREPRSKTFPSWLIWANKMRHSIKKILHGK